MQDDASALDLGTVKGWALIVRVAVAEYLGLDPELNARARRSVGELVSPACALCFLYLVLRLLMGPMMRSNASDDLFTPEHAPACPAGGWVQHRASAGTWDGPPSCSTSCSEPARVRCSATRNGNECAFVKFCEGNGELHVRSGESYPPPTRTGAVIFLCASRLPRQINRSDLVLPSAPTPRACPVSCSVSQSAVAACRWRPLLARSVLRRGPGRMRVL